MVVKISGVSDRSCQSRKIVFVGDVNERFLNCKILKVMSGGQLIRATIVTFVGKFRLSQTLDLLTEAGSQEQLFQTLGVLAIITFTGSKTGATPKRLQCKGNCSVGEL